MTSTITMNDDLLDNYNPLYDVHLRQYFAMPHMQRHLRNIGLLDDAKHGESIDDREANKQHHATIDKMLRNREAELQKYADLQRKLHAAEKIETCRRIRSGAASPSDYHRVKASRSLSRGRYIKRSRRRQSSVSSDDKDLVQKIEAENEEPMYENPSLVYNRLSTNILKYRYLHKLDDETLALYMEQLRRQLSRLERFRQVSFGPFSVARHQNDPQVSWFFRRRSLPSLTDTTLTTTITTTTTTTTLTSSTTQSNIYEQPTLRSTQPLSQHRSRSSKPELSRNTVSANSYDLQSKHQRSTDNARLPPTSRSVKTAPTTNNNINAIKKRRTRKLTPTEAKKIPQKPITTVLTGSESQEVIQKIKPKVDSEVADVQATISDVHKLVAKSEIESVEHRSEESPENYDNEHEASEYSGIISPEDTDLIPKTETVSEKSVSPIEHSEMPMAESDVSEKMIGESKIEQPEIESQQNSNLPFDLSSKISEKTELEAVNMIGISETPLISKLTESEIVESHVSRDTTIDSIPNETDSLEVVLSEEIDEDDIDLAKNWMKTENKSEELLTGENLTTYGETMQNDHQQNHHDELARRLEKLSTEEMKLEKDKMTVGKFEKNQKTILSPTMNLETEKLILPEDVFSGITDAEISFRATEKESEDNNTFSQTEPTSYTEVTPNTTDWDVNESAAINGKILDIPSAENLKIEDSIMTSKIYSLDQNEAEKNLIETLEDPKVVTKDLASLTVSLEKINAAEKLESIAPSTEIEFSDGEQEVLNHFMKSAKIDSKTEQDVREDITERLSKSPKSVPIETSTTKEESPELQKSEILHDSEQLETSIENEQETSIAGYLNGKIEVVTKKIEELESARDAFHMEKFPDFSSVNEQLEYQEKDIAMENNVIEENIQQAKAQQLEVDVNGLESNEEFPTEQKSESLLDVSMNDESLIENHYSQTNEGIIKNVEFEQEKKEIPEAWLGEQSGGQIPDTETKSAMEITNEEAQEVIDVLQTQSEAVASVANDSFTEQFSKCMDSSKYDDELTEKNKASILETGEMIIIEREKLSEITSLKPENVVIMGMTNNLESVISGIQETQSLISSPLETAKQESGDQVNAFTSDISDTTASKSNHLSEKEHRIEETGNIILDKSTDGLKSAKIESESCEDIEDSVASSILRSDMISTELNPEIAAEKESEDQAPIISEGSVEEVEIRKQEIEENEMLETNYASQEQQISEFLSHESMEKIDTAKSSKFDEGIPKIVVYGHETPVSDVEKLSFQPDKKTSDLREQFQVDENVETLDQQKMPLKEIEKEEESEISKNKEAITSTGYDTSEGIDDEKQLVRGQLNEFLQQYMHDMIQDVAQIAEEKIRTNEALGNEKRIDKIDEGQHASSTPEFIPRFPAGFSEIDFPKSEFDGNLQESHCNVLSSMLTAKSNDSDGNTEITELSDTNRELMNVSHSYLTDITGEEGDDHYMPTKHRSSVEQDSSLQEVRSNAAAEFSEDIQNIGQIEKYSQELELEKEKLELKTAQSINGSSTNNMLSKYHLIINGITADGKLILCSVGDSMISSEDKFINYFALNTDDSATINDKIPSTSDRNGNPEWKVDDMQHIPSDVISESNICEADVNANISALQQIDRMNSVKYEEERDQHSILTDEHSLLEQSSTGTECEVINMNSK